MRIISGRFKGRILKAPNKLPVRPTTDQAKEGLFNILHNWYDFEGLKVLDLFAGTGNIGYEFWSRGVAHLTSVDRHSGCVNYIKGQFREMGIEGEVRKSETERFLRSTNDAWDIIFMDPPYGMEGLAGLVEMIFDRGVLTDHGTLILEHPSQESYTHLNRFSEERKYGGSVFSFFEKQVLP